MSISHQYITPLIPNYPEAEVDRTLYVGNLDEKVTESLLTDLFVQSGPLESVCIPASKENEKKKTYAFVCYKHACSVPYTINIMSGIQLFDKTLSLQYRPQSIHAKNERDVRNNSTLQRSYSAPGVQTQATPLPLPLNPNLILRSQYRSVPLQFHNSRDEQRDRDYKSYDESRRARDYNRHRRRDRSRSKERRHHRY